MIALLEAHTAGLLKRSNWLRNIISGCIVGVVALPLAMAFAIASGAKPEQGLYTAIIAGFIVSAFGGSRVQIAGPTGAFVVILAGVTAKYGIQGLQTATLMAGCILLLLGAARLGSIIKFIPDPVITGFTAGIGVIIWIGQWKDFFGLPAVSGAHFHEKFWHLLQALPHFHVATTALACFSLFLLLVTPKIQYLRRIPAPLIALVFATVLQASLHLPGVATIGSTFGGIPQGLPTWHAPDLSLSRMIELIDPAFAIAMLGAIESLLSAVIADGMTQTRHDSNQELIGQGVANILTPFFGGFAATGALARTATNVRSGGNSPLAGIVHALFLLLVVLVLAPLAVHIPLAVLAAILFVVAWNMSELKHVTRMLKRAPQADKFILCVTFGLTVFADLVVAVNIGVILSMLQFLRRMAASVEVRALTQQEIGHTLQQHEIRLPAGTIIYTIDGPFFFAAVETFENALATTHADPKMLVIWLRWVPFMDITGLQTLEEAVINFQNRGVRVILLGANARVHGKLEQAGIIDLIGRENYLRGINELRRFNQAENISSI